MAARTTRSRGCRPRARRASPERDPGRDGVKRARERELSVDRRTSRGGSGVHPGGRPVAAEADTSASVPPGGRTLASLHRRAPGRGTPGASVARAPALLAPSAAARWTRSLTFCSEPRRGLGALRRPSESPRGALTEQQTVDALATHAAPVCKAAARSAGDTGEIGWIAQAWRDVARAHFARRVGVPGGFCDAARFRALAIEAMHLVSERAEAEEEEEDARCSAHR